MQVLFVVGLAQNATTNNVVARENEVFQDIVIADFIDSYRNLSYKALTAFYWLNKYCNNVKHIVKTDDDVFVNPFILVQYLDRRNQSMANIEKSQDQNNNNRFVGRRTLSSLSKELRHSSDGEKHLNVSVNVSISNRDKIKNDPLLKGREATFKITSHSKLNNLNGGSFDCYTWNVSKVIRKDKSKWYVSKLDYSFDWYPQYCSGNAYIMDSKLLPILLTASSLMPFLWVDDAYITGVLREGCNIPLVNIRSLYELKSSRFHGSLLAGERMFLHNPHTDTDTAVYMWEAVMAKEHHEINHFKIPTQ